MRHREPLLGALLAVLAAACTPSQPQPIRRSVVLVVVDTLRADHLGTYGYARATSPALDRWSAQGAVFERALATSSWTVPSFGSLFTGRIPSAHGAGQLLRRDGVPIRRDGRKVVLSLDPGVQTLAELLARQGWATAAIVSNHFLAPAVGLARGFETYDFVPADNGDKRRARVVVDRAIDWLRHRDGRPFLLVLHFFDPHLAYGAPAPFAGRFTADYGGARRLPVTDLDGIRRAAPSLGEAERAFITAAYDEELAYADGELDRLRQALAAQSSADTPPLILFTADHGEELFDHDGFEHGHTLFQELVHVPLVVWGPGVRPGRVTVPVSLVDVVPTVLDALRVTAPDHLDGVSLWPLLRGDAPPPSPRALVAEGTLFGPDRRAIVRFPEKLIVGGERGRELFDLSADPREERNVAATGSDADTLARELDATVDRARAGRRGSQETTFDAVTLDRLRALGYLE